MYIAQRRKTSNALNVYEYVENKNVFRCLQKESVSADCRVSQVVQQQVPHKRTSHQRKPAGQMYSASGAVHSAVAEQQIGDDAVMCSFLIISFMYKD